MRVGLLPGSAGRWFKPEPFFFEKLARGLFDVGIWIVAGLGAYVLRFDFAVPSEQHAAVVGTVAAFVCTKLVATLVFQLHRQNWVKVSFRDARAIGVAMASAGAAAWLLLVVALPVANVPPSVPLIDAVLATMGMLVVRGGARWLDDRSRIRFTTTRRFRNVLIVGAGEAGATLVREMQRHPETGMRAVAFVDDDPAKIGRTISRVPVVGGLKQLPAALAHGSVDEILIAIPSADGRQLRSVVDRIRAANGDVPYRTMPSLHDLLSGTVTVSRIREVGIEDLLRRPPVKLDTDSILGYLQGKTVMVTGAGGSIGSELVRQICRFGPKRLILFGHGENSIYQLERELDRHWPEVPYSSVIGAVQNVVRLEYLFRTMRPDVVFHAAAHKHVPLMELNPEEAVFNNVVGSRSLVDLSLKYEVSHFVNISTDKAVNPTSVMGASKRLVELVVANAARLASPGQVFVSVRFGNVLGSRGSAIPLFKQQIKDGGPVTVTHPDMVRYFMTIPEASKLVLQASALGRNGETYILDMGEPVRVLDLVRDLIRLSGFDPDVDIAIEFTGVRPGEKMVEELMTEQEKDGTTEHEKIFVARSIAIDPDALDATIRSLVDAAMRSDGVEIRRLLGTGGPAPAVVLADGGDRDPGESSDDRRERVLLN